MQIRFVRVSCRVIERELERALCIIYCLCVRKIIILLRFTRFAFAIAMLSANGDVTKIRSSFVGNQEVSRKPKYTFDITNTTQTLLILIPHSSLSLHKIVISSCCI